VSLFFEYRAENGQEMLKHVAVSGLLQDCIVLYLLNLNEHCKIVSLRGTCLKGSLRFMSYDLHGFS